MGDERKQHPTMYSKQASGMLQHLGLGDESKILARHRKQESGVCMRGRQKQEHPLPPPSDSLKLKLIKEINVLYIRINP